MRAAITEFSVAREILDSLVKHARAPPGYEDESQDAVLVLDQDYG